MQAALPGTAPTWAGSAPDQPLPPPLPAPKLIRVTYYFTAEEYAIHEQAEKRFRSQARRRVRREEAAVEMARRYLAEAPARSRVRQQVLLHVDAQSGRGWYETKRGVLEATPAEVQRGLAEDPLLLVGESAEVGASAEVGETAQAGTRTADEQISGRKSRRNAVPVPTLRALFARAGGRCEKPGCGRCGPLHVHHLVPLSRGGTHDLENLQLLCAGCHGLGHSQDFRHDANWAKARARRRRGQAARLRGSPGA